MAQAFQRLAEVYVYRIAGEVREGAYERAPEELGDIAACAANLSFALELYLKALLVQLHLQPPKHHDLCKLYDAVPHDVKVRIESSYVAIVNSRWVGKRCSISLATGPRDEPSWSEGEDGMLPAVLKRSADVFQAWRYVYEFNNPREGGYEFHTFEYGLLLCACESLSGAIDGGAEPPAIDH